MIERERERWWTGREPMERDPSLLMGSPQSPWDQARPVIVTPILHFWNGTNKQAALALALKSVYVLGLYKDDFVNC